MGISMGKLGGLRPPQDFARALREFDPDLSAQWNYGSQSWWICQRVRRHRDAGTLDDVTLTAYEDVEVPVMQISSFPGALDSRVIDELQKERAVTLKEYERHLIQRQKDLKKKGTASLAKELDGATEEALNCWYDPTFRNQAGLPPRVTGFTPEGKNQNGNANSAIHQNIPAA